MSALTIAPVVTPPRADPHPVPPSIARISLGGVDPAALATAPPAPSRSTAGPRSLVALTGERGTHRFRVLGLTWQGSAPVGLEAWVRTRSAGAWSGWQEVHADLSHGPDAGSAEAARARGGSEPLIVAESDGVQVRVESPSGRGPKDLQVDLIDPGTAPSDATIGAAPPASSAVAAGTRPSMFTRAQWGADESLREYPPSYGTIKAGFVHHTAGTNSYSQGDVPAIIRGIYAFHVNGRGWNDIGYNFLVDKWGRIWEGRYGGAERPVIGAHTLGFNEEAFAMSTLGDFTSTTPPTAVLDAYGRLFAWKLGLHHVNPTGKVVMSDDNGPRTFNTISGHRDANSTSCPGTQLYAKLPTIRSKVKAAMGTTFWSPSLTRAAWSYAGGGVSIRGTVSRTLTWKVKVTSTCRPDIVVAQQSGSSTTTSGLTATWNGKTSTGAWAPPGGYRIDVTASSGTGTINTAVPWSTTVEVRRTAGAPIVWCPVRIAGVDRYQTSVMVARSLSLASKTIVLANGTDGYMSHAAVAGPLARAKGGVVLLSPSSGLPASVSAEIRSRGATTAYLIGGTDALSSTVESQLRSLGVTTIQRYGGSNRNAVAANVAMAMRSSAADVIIANGANTYVSDALAIAGPAAALQRPILYVDAGSVPAETEATLRALGAQRTVVVGSTASISDSVLAQLPSPTRLGADNRYDVSQRIATWARGKVPTASVLVGSGEPKALGETLAAGQLGRVTLLVLTAWVPPSVAAWLDNAPDLRTVTILGGPAALTDPTAGRAQRAVLE